MSGTPEKKPEKNICIGILAHVDAGKTTLSEGILYQTGTIRRLGRVDNRDAFLDTYALERARGITIFSKQAVFDLGRLRVTLLDTPGHVDFSAETERTLQVLDCAVLVVSGADGVQGHTETLWRLLKRYGVPTYIFVNKMDQAGTDWRAVLADMRKCLDGNCVPFNGLSAVRDGAPPDDEALYDAVPVRAGDGAEAPGDVPVLADVASGAAGAMEELAMCDEEVLERFLETGKILRGDVRRMVAARKVFPCYFGSALRLWGVEELLRGLEEFTGGTPGDPAVGGRSAGGPFGARVFKISRDEQGTRLTHLKVTSGILKVKDMLPSADPGGGAAITPSASGAPARGAEDEKVNQIRIYSGAKYELAGEAGPGVVCAVTGPLTTYAGQALGAEAEREQGAPVLEPVLTYQVLLPPGCDAHGMLVKLRQLEEEEPMLRIAVDESSGGIQAQVMGQVQIEVLKSLIRERFGTDVEFGAGHIVYKETITAPAEGIGHYEPLRHYAEVHLLLEPAPRGSGLTFATACSTDVLDLNWQRLILTHLEEKRHIGVLTGAPVTDMKITLLVGRAHLKHTEGGDFRQATYRAVRHGLMQALSAGNYQLLEPFYRFRLEVPMESAGRALSDLERMQARFAGPEMEGGMAVISGEAPVSSMGNYQAEVVSYSKGKGRLHCSLKGYEPCHNAEEVAAAAGYDPEMDMDNPCGSVFCAHGAGFAVGWRDVKSYMHLESPVDLAARRTRTAAKGGSASWGAEDKELEAIFARTYGPPKSRLPEESGARRVIYEQGKPVKNDAPPPEEYLLVDGYNIIYAWPELHELAETTIDGARQRLMDIMCNYQGYTGCILILVFDAYKVEGGLGQAVRYHNINVVYTKEAETADQYIEKLAHQMGRNHVVTVATSDGLEQLIIRGQGCRLMSARDLREAVDDINEQIRSNHLQQFPGRNGNYLLNHADGELREYLEEVRLGKEGDYHGGAADKK